MTYTRNIGSNRGKPRLWLEGVILTECGFKHGALWHLERNDDGSLTLLTSNAGTRRVAGTPERPIIDINSRAILLGLGPKVELRCLGDGIIHVENMAVDLVKYKR